ncbi:MAG: hypothetical protein EOO77_41445 [Oxalobacteraceae bacterium]|nr:MAG: hypothetical protein EOO77_41445 [Oxalobacteraceae bacterium]
MATTPTTEATSPDMEAMVLQSAIRNLAAHHMIGPDEYRQHPFLNTERSPLERLAAARMELHAKA